MSVAKGCQELASLPDARTAIFENLFERVEGSFWLFNCNAPGERVTVRSVETNRADPNMTTTDKTKGNMSTYCKNPRRQTRLS